MKMAYHPRNTFPSSAVDVHIDMCMYINSRTSKEKDPTIFLHGKDDNGLHILLATMAVYLHLPSSKLFLFISATSDASPSDATPFDV